MASLYFAKKGVAWGLPIKLFPQASTEWLASPTIAAGDFKRIGYSSALVVTLAIDNPTTIPATTPASSGWVMLSLSTTEMNNDIVVVDWKDASGAEWASGGLVIFTTADGVDDLVTTTDPVASVTAGVTLADGAITAAKIADGAIDADALAADAVAEIQSGLATAAALATVDTVVDAILVDTAEIGAAGAGLTAVASAANLATLTGYVDTEIASILAAVDTEIATLATNVAAILQDTGTDGVVLSTAQMQALADIVLGRSVSNAEDAAGLHSVTELILAILESSTATGSWVIKKTDGSTTFNTRTLTTDANAVPITGVS